MIELERTFLAKYLPKDIENFKQKKIIDVYVPHDVPHPIIRIRKNGERMEITKKLDIEGADLSEKQEETIPLTEAEYKALMKLEGKRIEKIRYYYPFENITAEFDVFGGELTGLVEIDFEFDRKEDLEAFIPPDYCLVDVTDDDAFAGGMLAGKKYKDLESLLMKHQYQSLSLKARKS